MRLMSPAEWRAYAWDRRRRGGNGDVRRVVGPVLGALVLFLVTIGTVTMNAELGADGEAEELQAIFDNASQASKLVDAGWRPVEAWPPGQDHVCGGWTRKRFAVVTLLSRIGSRADGSSDDAEYVLAVRRLGESVKRWSWTQEFRESVDMIALLVRPIRAGSFRPALHVHGWRACEVGAVDEPEAAPGDATEFHRGVNAYSKLLVWNMTAFEAVLYLDADTMVVGDLMPLFRYHYPLMVRERVQLAAVTESVSDGPQCRTPTYDDPAVRSPFNAGVLLARPDPAAFAALLQLASNMGTQRLAEQAVLNTHYKARGARGVLPFAFNADVCEARCNHSRWAAEQKVVVHFTCAKPWSSGLNQWQLHSLPYAEVWNALPPFVRP